MTDRVRRAAELRAAVIAFTARMQRRMTARRILEELRAECPEEFAEFVRELRDEDEAMVLGSLVRRLGHRHPGLEVKPWVSNARAAIQEFAEGVIASADELVRAGMNHQLIVRGLITAAAFLLDRADGREEAKQLPARISRRAREKAGGGACR
jgi:hypothetical protein